MKGIIGAICGDIIGSTREFRPIKTKSFELLEERSGFTDDTVLTLAIASWLVKDDSRSKNVLVDEIKSFAKRYPHAGYGGRFRRWFMDDNSQPYNSWGNGSAMRVSPVGWVCDTLEETQILAKISAEVTHNHPEGIKGAVATASAIYLARTGESKEFIREYVESVFNYDLSRKLDDIRDEYNFEVSCQKSVPESIICFLEAEDYVDAIRNAISLGGDADTMAAIAGSIAAAYYDVPDDIVNMCKRFLSDYLLLVYEDYVDKFLQTNSTDRIFSNIEGDVPFESIDFDNGISVIIEYVAGEDESASNYNGKFTSKYRKITLIGDKSLHSQIFEENPYYSKKAELLNDEWQKSNRNQEFMDESIQIIHEGLELDDIKERIIDDEEYMVVLWHKGFPPLPVDLGTYKDLTLELMETSNTLSELVLNLLYRIDQ